MIESTVALILFLFPLAYSPGPGNMFFAVNGARFGFCATLWASFGYHVATWMVTLAIGLGFASVMERFPQMFVMLKVAGSFYVLWLAGKLFRSAVLKDEGKACVAGFFDGAILLLLNPKAYVIIALMFTQFLEASEDNRAIFLITSVFTINNLIAFTIWTALGDAISRQFRADASAKKLNILFSAVLVSVAIWMLVF